MNTDSSLTPLFSIVIPCYGAERFIKTTLASIYAQTETDYEIVVVHDESPDSTLAILQAETDPRLRIIDQKNEGECGARNRGIREARGKYIAFLDSDDAWYPHHLELARYALEEHPDTSWFVSQHRRIEEISPSDWTGDHAQPKQVRTQVGRWFLMGDARTRPSCVVARRESLPCDPFPVGVKMHGDTVGWMRLAALHPTFIYTDEVTMLYRIWGGSASDNYLRAFASPENNTLTIMSERAKSGQCSEEELLFYQEFSMTNWWQRLSASTLISWIPEITRRSQVTGGIISLALKLSIWSNHLLIRATRFLVNRKRLAIRRRQRRLIQQWEREQIGR